MATNPMTCAALAAMFSLGLTAQAEAPFAQHLAAAKLAQTRGDFAAALKELRLAQETAPADQQEQVQRAVRSLAGAQAGVLAQDPQAGDPVRRLIAVLDTGSRDDAAVHSAYDQLAYLGALVVPQLLDAVPTFGPFGLRNALGLLACHDDARIAQVLAKRMDDADPSVTAAIAAFVDDAQPAVALPLAVKVAAVSNDPGQLLPVLRTLLRNDPDNPATPAAAEKVLTSASPKVLAELLDSMQGCTAAWVADVLNQLRQRGDDKTRANATHRWLERQSNLSEDRALQALQTMPAGSTCGIAALFAQRNPTWNRVALLALRSAADETMRSRAVSLHGLGEVVWGDLRDEAGSAMLAVPLLESNRRQDLDLLARAIIAAGWTVPLGQESHLLEMLSHLGGEASKVLLEALPADDEDRAIGAWRTLSRDQQAQFVVAAKDLRPWHRLVANHLLTSERQRDVNVNLFERDWSGAPPEAIAALTELATRWPCMPPNSSGWRGWQMALVGVWARTPDLPAEVILPLIAAGDRDAWTLLYKREPERAVAWLRTSTNRDAADVMKAIELLRRFGTDQDVPIAIWALHQLAGQPPNSLSDFFVTHGRGNLDVIALGKLPVSTHPSLTALCVMVAAQAAQGAHIDDLDALLGMTPVLGSEAAYAVLRALLPQVRPTDAERILTALEATLVRVDRPGNSQPAPMLNDSLQDRYLNMLATTADSATLPRLRALLEHDAMKSMQGAIARTCLAIGGDQKKALITAFFQSENAEVAATALAAPEVAGDDALRQLGKATILRLGEQMPTPRLDWRPEDRDNLAVAIVTDTRFPQFTAVLSKWALRVLGTRQDTTFLTEIATATRHTEVGVRVAAAQALGNTFSRDAAPFLLELLKDNAEVQKAAQAALDRIASYLDERKKWEERLK